MFLPLVSLILISIRMHAIGIKAWTWIFRIIWGFQICINVKKHTTKNYLKCVLASHRLVKLLKTKFECLKP